MTGTDDRWFDGPTLTDEAVDQLVAGTTTDPDLARLAMFARQVQFQGELPPPEPSPELAALLRGQDVETVAPPAVAGRDGSLRRTVAAGWAGAVGKVAGLGLAAKVGLGTAVAATGVVTASTVGVLPPPVNDAVRQAIEAVTPFELDHDEPSGDDQDRDQPGGDTETDPDDELPVPGDGEPELVPGSPAPTDVPDQSPTAPSEGSTTVTTTVAPRTETTTPSTTSGGGADVPAEATAEPAPDPTTTPAPTTAQPPSDPRGQPPVPTGPGDHGPPTPRPSPPGRPDGLPPAHPRADAGQGAG